MTVLGDYFLRPVWLLAIPVLLLLLWWLCRLSLSAGFAGAIRSDMRQALRIESGSSRLIPVVWVALILVLTCLALAGPVWQEDQQQGYNRQGTVVLLDLSPSMLAEDLQPSRLVRARLKLTDLLRSRHDGETALIAYAGDAHLVAPLTDDTRVIEALVPILEPSIMPLAGSHPEAAVAMALSLFKGADLSRGDIVMITDGVDAEALPVITGLLQGSRLSILQVATAVGAPVPDTDGKYLLDDNGQPRIDRPDSTGLKALARQSGGKYSVITTDSADIDALTSLPLLPSSIRLLEDAGQFDQRSDSGYWLLPVLLVMGAFGFRRNVLWLFVIIAFLPPQAFAGGWRDLWSTPDQQAALALANGDAARAAELFSSLQWQAVARYNNAEYQRAAELFNTDINADAFYNMGNAYALDGNTDAAIEAYRIAISIDVKHRDAAFNLALLKSLLAQQDVESDQQENQRGSGDAETSVSSADSEAPAAPASAAEQLQVGGSAGQSQTLDQSSLSDGGRAAKADESVDDGKLADDATVADNDNGAEFPAPDQPGVDTGISVAVPEGNGSSVLNPYSEQWLRNLPQDPGGYMRRKFHYQAQIRRASGNIPPDAVLERY